MTKTRRPLKYAVLNNKGAVGKSTLAVHIAHGLALKRNKVLLIDMDGQNDASLFLGFTSEDYAMSLYDLIFAKENTDPSAYILKAKDYLDLLPSRHMEKVNTHLYQECNISSYLEDRLQVLESAGYDYIIIDCGPQRSKINDAVLYYVDGIIIPVQVEAASVRAIGNIYEYLADLGLDSRKVALIVPNMYDQRTSDGRENLDFVKDFFADSDILTEPIYRRIKITETGKLGRTVYETDKEAARQFDHVIERLVKIDGRRRK